MNSTCHVASSRRLLLFLGTIDADLALPRGDEGDRPLELVLAAHVGAVNSESTHSRLYRRRVLREHTHWRALDEIYKS